MGLWLAICLSGLAGGAGPQAEETRYFRQAGEKLALESVVTVRRDGKATVLVSVTDRGAEKMTLSVRLDGEGRLLSAEAIQETKAGKKVATLTPRGKSALLKREGGLTEELPLAERPVVTTAPDWTDIFEVVRRYDRERGGKQEFPGLWIHPTQPARVLTFTAERLGEDPVTLKGRKLALGRYRVTLRSGAYLVWAEGGRVHKLMPEGRPAGAVFCEGSDEATRGLK
ncbi:MAG: hypothetical protein L0Z62_33730 [Gemmataceae bacterium]|nr:hypothetical protein [Gemmataceae bacterium]